METTMSDIFKLKLEDSPFPQAMDVYYDQLDALVNSMDESKVALTSNLVDFPLREDTPLYNAYVSRAFADRCISVGSPMSIGEKFFGPANVNDRFSHQYEVLLNRAITSVNVSLDQAALNRIEEADREIVVLEDKLDELIDSVLDSWEQHKSEHLQDIDEDELEMRMVAWFDTHRLRRRIDSITKRIDRWTTVQETTIEGAGTPEDAQIYRTYNALRNSQVAYPKDPSTETKYELNPISMANVLRVGSNPAWADIGADVDVIADWQNILAAGGTRNFQIDRTTASVYTHERKWSASAKLRYGFFFSAKLKASEHTKLRDSISDSISVGLSFKRISEAWIRRGDWYDSSIFNLPKVRAILEKDRKLAMNLKYSVSALIIGRGLDLSLGFEHEEEHKYFRAFSASGSAKFLDVLPFGSGSVNETTTRLETDDANKKISFKDDETVCRLLGLKLDVMHDLLDDREVLDQNLIFETQSELEAHVKSRFNLNEETELLL